MKREEDKEAKINQNSQEEQFLLCYANYNNIRVRHPNVVQCTLIFFGEVGWGGGSLEYLWYLEPTRLAQSHVLEHLSGFNSF